MEKNIFNYNRFLKPICNKLTNHSYCRFIGCDHSFITNGYKYPNRHDFYYKCNICGYVFFTHKINKENLKKLKEKIEKLDKIAKED